MKKLSLILIAALLTAAACKSVEKKSEIVPQNDPNLVVVDQPQLSLVNYLRRIPGLLVSNDGRVLVRGATTLSDQTDPLVLVDNVPVTNRVDDLEGMVSINDIATIRVLKDGSETAMYGARGNNGVILIRTKQQ